MLMNGLDLRGYRYAYIGTEDWTMDPLIPPGSLVLIDESRPARRNHRVDRRKRPPHLPG